MTKAIAEPARAHDIDIQWGLAKSGNFPEDSIMIGWIKSALARVAADDVAISIRMMDSAEIAGLNQLYRDKSSATNVLSFPAEGRDEEGRRLMGDIAICTEVVAAEANEQNKALQAHMAHMLVHGVLHLAGYDHVKDKEAEKMERLEVELLAGIGFPNPYGADHR